MKNKLVMILVLVVIIIASVALGAFVVGPKFLGSSEDAVKPHKDGPVVSIGDFTINLKGGSYFKMNISLEGVDEKSAEQLTAKEAFLRDRVISVMTGKSVTDVTTQEAIEKLRQELLTQLNEVSGQMVQNVLFTTYVYQ
ncbi:MAG: flagellar basal body-associated FliL family protein [Peptococcaceae bacterium]|jgi:flagellar FliL protein|nr:flagellar basal body-associated FliL family protein [Peptococcaceae bacterium]